MPYPGVPPSKTKDMESCVEQVMGEGKSKQEAIAICHKSIMGKSEDILITKDQDGKEVKNVAKKDVDETKVVEKTEEPEATKEADEIIEKAEEEAPAEEAEAKVEKADEPEATEEPEPVEKAEEPEKEPEKEPEEVIEKEEAPEEEAEAELEKEEEAEKEPDAMEKLIDAINSLNDKIDNLSELVKQSPDEGVAATEETPKDGAEEEAPEEEVEKVSEPEKPEPAKEEEVKAEPEVTEKADTSSDGDSAELQKTIDTLTKRIEELEKSPAPSKIVVSKGFVGNIEEDKERMTQITKRLGEIEDIRDKSPHKYNDQIIDEALALVAERKALQGRK